MTSKELGEIERLAEEWHRHEHFSDAPPLAKRVLPLVKAVREAEATAKEAQDDARLAECMLDEIVELAGSGGDGSAFGSVESLLCDLKERTEERDEAQAEVKRLNQLNSSLSEELQRLYQKEGQSLEDWKGLQADHAAAKADVERLNKRLESEQHYVDAVCHYRNLAIVLGAKPNQMLGKFDRDLCESGIDPDETSGGYHISVNQELDALKDVWAEVERLRSVLRLLWEEATDEERCANERAPGCYSHALSQPTRKAVEAALKEGE